MEKSFISPLNDYVVKCIYGDQKNIGNTEGLLKTILDIPPEEYGRLTVIDPFLKRRWKKDKQGIVDIRLATLSGRQVAIELQVLPYRAMLPRIVYSKVWFNTPELCSGSHNATLTNTWY